MNYGRLTISSDPGAPQRFVFVRAFASAASGSTVVAPVLAGTTVPADALR